MKKIPTPQTPDEPRLLQDALFQQHLSFATTIARREHGVLSGMIDFDEVLAFAHEGLFDAARRYDASQKVNFRTFARPRIKGSIYDGFRKRGWLPRAYHKEGKDARPTLLLMDDLEERVFGAEDPHDTRLPQGHPPLRKAFQGALAELSEKDRNVILMYYIQQFTLEEIGDKLGLSTSWMSRRCSQALARLFRKMRTFLEA